MDAARYDLPLAQAWAMKAHADMNDGFASLVLDGPGYVFEEQERQRLKG